jgi:hypothetical protein
VELAYGDVKFVGNEFEVGLAGGPSEAAQADGYGRTGIWSGAENVSMNTRNELFFRWLIRNKLLGDIVLQSTLTSFLEFGGLLELCHALPEKGAYGGVIKCAAGPDGRSFHSFVSGANTYMSRDVFQTYVDRLSRQTSTRSLANDVLTGYLLRDHRRIGVPFFSFDTRDSREVPYFLSVLEWARRFGFFHFRFKASTADQVLRDSVDSRAWLAAYDMSHRYDFGDPIVLSLLYSGLLDQRLLQSSDASFEQKLAYFTGRAMPMFLSQVLKVTSP